MELAEHRQRQAEQAVKRSARAMRNEYWDGKLAQAERRQPGRPWASIAAPTFTL